MKTEVRNHWVDDVGADGLLALLSEHGTDVNLLVPAALHEDATAKETAAAEAEAAAAAAEAAKPKQLTDEEKKALRDARYAARKASKKRK